MPGVKGRSGGRNRKTPEQHVLEGTHRRDRHGSKPETDPSEVFGPRAEFASLVAPAGLVKAERVYWATFAPLLAGAKVLTPADVQSLADYCRSCVAVDDFGRRLRTAFRKRTVDRLLVATLDTALRGWLACKLKLAGELGLTAIARTRLGWSGHPQVATPKTPTSLTPTSKLAQLQAQAAELRRPLGVNGDTIHGKRR